MSRKKKTPPPPIDWEVLEVHGVIDGDTADLRVRRNVGTLDGFDIDATGIIRARLVHLDTPEEGKPNYERATDELFDWLHQWDKSVDGGLRVTTQGKDSFGRYLSDVYAAADRSLTASDYMIRVGHWPVFTG